jgi:hypothetical protein
VNLASRIVVLGGYGNFGARIVRALAKDARYDIYVAGRRRESADALTQAIAAEFPRAKLHAVELDIGSPSFVRQLGAIAPIVVVHAAGPFQEQDYKVAEACLACRSHYVDLADGRRFVSGIRLLDREARRRDVLVVTGASTLPGISSAVVDMLTREMASVHSIECSIAPAGQSPRGSATIAGVLSYCGKPIRRLEHGAWIVRHGWQDARTVEYPHFKRRVAACDVPDLALFPERYPSVETVSFHAGPERSWQQVALWLMAAAARARLIRDWSHYAPIIARLDRRTRGPGLVGAMRVRVSGHASGGAPLARTWTLIAGSNHGPEVPCAPAIVLAKRLAAGETAERGAKPCLGLIDMSDLEVTLAGFDIDWTVTEERTPC